MGRDVKVTVSLGCGKAVGTATNNNDNNGGGFLLACEELGVGGGGGGGGLINHFPPSLFSFM